MVRRSARRPARRLARRPARRAMRILRTPRDVMPVFTETWFASPITVSAGIARGQLTLTGSSIPQMPDYSLLYRQFRILKCQWILMPRFQVLDPNTQQYNMAGGTPSTGNGRFVYAINNTAGLVSTPATELDVLQDNGCKIMSVARQTPIRITHKPVAQLNVSSTVAFNVYVNKPNQWLNTDSVGNNGSGTSVVHGSVSYFITMPQGSVAPADFTVFDVYCKTTFQLKDAA